MLGTFRIGVINVQLQQLRLGHRIRGRPPISARSLKQRLDELNYKDELYTTRIDIGFPPNKKSSDERRERMAHLKKINSDKNLEQLARNHELLIDTNAVREEWQKTLAPYHKKQIAEHYAIYKHLYGEGYFVPYVNLEVFYDLKDDSWLPVCFGNIIKPREAKDSPEVKYESDGNALWTLALTSLDGHLTKGNKEYIHWLVANIPGNQVEKGDTLVEYLQPFPPKGTGFQRFVFVLYNQKNRVSYDIQKVTTSSPLDSRTFVTRDWYQKHEDVITPAGLAFFQSDWDSTLKEFFHNTLNMKEPIYEYDFPQPYIRKQEWFPRRKPFNLYMDKYRDPKQINKEYFLRKLKSEDPFQKPKPPLRFPCAHAYPKDMPSWLKLHEKKIRLGWGRVNDI